MTLQSTVTLALLLLLQILPQKTEAHGMMCTPRQRGAYHSEQKCGSDLPEPKEPVTDHCAHCLNGGTVSTVKSHLPPGGWKVYEPVKDYTTFGNRAGLCGDPVGTDDHMMGGRFMPPSYDHVPLVGHWKTGSRVDFSVEIDTNHNGYFEFFLCNLDDCQSNDISESCFRNNHCVKLLRVKHPDCESSSVNTNMECGPIDDKYPGRWYAPCRKTDHVGVHVVGGESGTMRYQLPDGFECTHCVLQWYWATANSCAPRGLLDYMERLGKPFGSTCPSDGGGLGTYREGMTECGNDVLPEEFWSCADVQISRDGTDVGPVKNVGGGGGSGDGMDGQDGPTEQTPQQQPDGGDQEREEEEKTEEDEEDVCIPENGSCNGTIPCCDSLQVCIFSRNEQTARCVFWWDLLNQFKRSD